MIQNSVTKYMFNRRSSDYLVLIITLIISIFVIYKGYEFYEDGENAAVESCILSIKTSLINTIMDKKEVREVINPNQEWRVLSKSEEDFLLKSVINPKSLDCGRFSYFTEAKTQSGKYLQISVRQIDGKIDVSIKDLE